MQAAVKVLVAEAVRWRRVTMDSPQVVVQQGDIAARDLDRRRTVPEDPLEAEHVATIAEERPGERVAQDVGRTERLQARTSSEPMYQLIEPSRSQSVSARTREQRIVVADPAPMAQPGPERLASSSANRNEALFTALPEHAAPTLGEVHISDT